MLHLLKYENQLWNSSEEKDIKLIAGADEVGRGCIAGPIVAASIVWDKNYILDQANELKEIIKNTFDKSEFNDFNIDDDFSALLKNHHKLRTIISKIKKSTNPKHQDLLYLLQIKDSKKVTKKNRPILAEFIKNKCLNFATYEATPQEIDTYGISWANQKVLSESLKRVGDINAILVDHFNIQEKIAPKQIFITKGDSISLTIAAASIIAKVYRDNLMEKFHQQYSNYELDKNVGYGTANHMQAIKKYGLTEIHRKSFNLGL